MMKKSILLSLILCLLLSACSRKKTESPLVGQTIYVPEDVTFITGQNSVNGICTIEDNVYLLCWDGNGTSAPKIFQFSAIEREVEEMMEFQSALSGGECFITGVAIHAGENDTLWITEKILRQSFCESTQKFEQEEVFSLRQLNNSGKELACFEYSALEENLGMGIVDDLLVDSAGTIFVETDQGVAILDEMGAARFSIKADDWFDARLILLGNGRIGVSCVTMDTPGEYTCSLHLIDKESGGLGEGWQLAADTPNLVSVYDGDANALFYYKIGDSLCAWREGDAESTQITNLTDIGIVSSVRAVSSLTDESLVLLSGNEFSDISLNILTATDSSLVQNKKILTYATLQLTGNQREAVIAFNRTSKDYHISVTDYSQYGNRQAAMTRLATEIGAGRMPDIIDLYGIQVSRWVVNGLLEDLWPYIDGDMEISRDGLMERVFRGAAIDGKLYEVGSHFWMSTLTGAKNVVGDGMTWTGADMWKALETMPEDCVPTSDNRSSMLKNLMCLDWSRFVNWEDGTCNFESEDFQMLLDFCSSFPEKTARIGERGIYEGRQMLVSTVITGFEFPQRARFLLGGDISYIGYPNEWGKVGSSFSFVSSMAMSSSCKDKEGAWSFLRTFLLPHDEVDLQAGIYKYFPVNKEDFQKEAELAMMPEYETNKDGTYFIGKDGERVEMWKSVESFDGIAEDCLYYATTKAEYDQLMTLYNSIDTYSRWDPDLESIILETSEAYFAGDKSLDDTLALLQNRVSLYVNEQT